MSDYVDLGIKVIGFAASMCAGAFGLAWWLGSRLDKITTQVLHLELRLAQRLTRLETKIFYSNKSSDQSFDD